VFRGALLLPLCLAAGCAASPANSGQAETARVDYESCLRGNIGRIDDGVSNPGDVGVTLAGFCLQEFSRYRALSGVDEGLNEQTATRMVISKRHL
jgi:hypothetical protein